MKVNPYKRVVKGFIALVISMSTIVGMFSPFSALFAATVDDFYWGFSELSNGTAVGAVTEWANYGTNSNGIRPAAATTVNAHWAGTLHNAGDAMVLTLTGTISNVGSEPVHAKNYVTIRDGLEIQVHEDTKLSYYFAPQGRQTVYSSNNYDYKYHGAHMAVDVKFEDGTYMRNIPGVIDQYGIGMHPVDQGEGKVLKTSQWNYVECELGKFADGKVVTDIIIGFEMPDATPGHRAVGSFDAIKIFRDGRDYSQIEPADFVDIRHGGNWNANATGAMTGGAALPNGFQYWAPATAARNGSNISRWSSSTFYGITTSKLASRHMGERLTFLFMANATNNNYTASSVNSMVTSTNAAFSHDNEFAYSAYHYGVTFNENSANAAGVSVEVTPTTYGAVLRFTFPATSNARNVLFDAPYSTTSSYSAMTSTDSESHSFTGWCQSGADTNDSTTGNSSLRRNFLYGEFDVEPTFNAYASTSIRTVASFPDLANGPDGSTVVEMRVATSFISADQAKKNLGMDIVGIDKDDDVTTWTYSQGKWFEGIKADAKAVWNELLGRVEIDDPTANYWQLSNFYSKLTRSYMFPTTLSEYTGKGSEGGWQNASPYRGTNANPIVMDGRFIYNEGWWDTFKSKWPLLGFLTPDYTANLTDGIVQHYIDQTGLGTATGVSTSAIENAHAVPRWINPGGNNMMTGTSSDAVTADMYVSYGVPYTKVYEAYQAWTKSAAVVTPNSAYGGRTGLQEGIFKGYHPWGTSTPAGGGGQLDTTWSLEGYINDATQVQMLRKMADEVDVNSTIDGKSGAYWKERWLEEAVYYEYRAKNYVNQFDSSQPVSYTATSYSYTSTGSVTFSNGWFMNRYRDGSFNRKHPLMWGGGFTEDNAWPYRVLVPQDGRGLANLLGSAQGKPGAQALGESLDEGFNAEGLAMDYYSGASSSVTGGYGTNPGWIHEGHEKRETHTGQFGLSNQTAYHMPWMYNHSDRPWMAQYWTRTAIVRMYSGEAIGYGYMGEEDNGASASWMVWASLGLYPLDLASGQLVISSPAFRNTTITDDRGKKITINAPENSWENIYIQSMKVNGEDYHKLYLETDLLKEDLVIDYVMGSEPNKTWFTEAPPSLTQYDGVTPENLSDLTYEGIPLISTDIPSDQSTAVASVTNVDLTGDNSAYYLFDDMSADTGNNSSQNQTKTTYDVNFTATTTSITYFNPDYRKVEIYTLTSSATADSDPKDWTLSGSVDGVNWILLDQRADEVFNWRRYTRPFMIDEDKQGHYTYYKLDITAASGTDNLILAEVEFLAKDQLADWQNGWDVVAKKVTSFAGDSVTVSAEVFNFTDTAGNVNVIAGLYTAEGILVSVANGTPTPLNVPAGTSRSISSDVVLDASNAGEDCFVRVFVWDPVSYIPIAQAATLR